MNRVLSHLLELLGVGGLIWLMAFIPWTKMVLGGVLTILGAFFPSLNERQQPATEHGQIAWSKFLIKFRGTIRFAVVVAGMILIVGAVLDGYEASESASPGNRAARAVLEMMACKDLVMFALEADARKRNSTVSLTESEIYDIVSKAKLTGLECGRP